jgi:hypothetical protein
VLPVEDALTALTVRKVDGEAGVARWLEAPSYLRVLQIGARGTMALLWSAATPEDERSLPRAEGLVATTWLWWHADALTIDQSAHARDRPWFDWPVPRRLDATMRLSHANHFTPTPPLPLTSIGMQFTNFEVFLQQPHMGAARLWRLCRALEGVFAEGLRGRCELRYGKGGKLFRATTPRCGLASSSRRSRASSEPRPRCGCTRAKRRWTWRRCVSRRPRNRPPHPCPPSD